MDNSTQQGLAALKAGNKSLARTLFRKAIQQNHDDTQAWLGLSAAVESDFEKVQCLQTIIKIDPNHKIAKTALDQLVGRLFHGDELNLDNPNLGSTMTLKQPAQPTSTTSANPPADSSTSGSGTSTSPFITRFPHSSEPDPFEILRTRYAAMDNQADSQPEPVPEKLQSVFPEKNPSPAALEVKGKLPQQAEMPAEQSEAVKQAIPEKTSPKNQWLRIVLIGGGVLLAFLFVAGLVIIGIISGSPKGTPTPAFMGIAKPVLPLELTQTATNAKVAYLPPTETATPEIPSTKTPEPSPTYPMPNRTVEARFKTIQTQVSDLRGLPIIQENVPAYAITKSQAQEYFTRYVSSDSFAVQLETRKKALVLLGLVSPTFDMYSEVINHMVDNIGGFYTPDNQEIYIVTGLGVSGADFMTYAHEYDHALVDQNYKIRDAGVYPTCKFSSDHCKAIEALFEGDAELLMEQWAKQYITQKDILELINSPQPFYMPENQAIPPYLAQDALFTYTYGKQFVKAYYQSGNWDTVDKLYGRLPISTTQIMHPDKYNINAQPADLPDKAVSQRLGDGWSLITDDALGEWMTYLMLAYNADKSAQVDPRSAKVAAAGWNGDHYQVFENKATHTLAMSAHWMFDTSPDVGEFSNIMKLMLETRNRGNRLDWLGRDCWQANSQISCYFSAGKEGLWLIGPDEDTIAAMLSGFPTFPQK